MRYRVKQIKFPEDFQKAVIGEFPDRNDIREMLKTGNAAALTFALQMAAEPRITNDQILKADTLAELKTAAQRLKNLRDLHQRCVNHFLQPEFFRP